MNYYPHLFVLLCLVATSCGGPHRGAIEKPTSPEILKAFEDIDAAVPVVTGAVTLTWFAALNGNALTLAFPSNTIEAEAFALALGFTNKSSRYGAGYSEIKSRSDPEYPWRFRILHGHTNLGPSTVVFRGMQPYN